MIDSNNEHEYSNHLVGQTSPYLLQHAHNPVDWYPWTEEALEKARSEAKPILLSIGYSACHWCHVMAHESFENQFTAEVMNNLFINIKVDREERPDLDKIYQLAHQVLTQRGGGWPLTMILTPDNQMPFFAGTYFPDQARANMPAFTEILQRVETHYRNNQDEVLKQNDALNNVLQQVYTASSAGNITLSSIPIDQARQQLKDHYDGLYGGFGEAPKFPHPSNVERLLRHWYATSKMQRPDISALDMAVTSLKSMALGGIYDHLGGGFYRYSVDQEWMIPHFEKMLYDNGPLLTLYADAWCATQEPLFEKVALETAEWVIAEMQSSQGGYYSTLDADSEGKEGQFYIWTPQEVKALLEPDQYAIFANIYGLDKIANFEGHWHLHTYNTLEDAAKLNNIDPAIAREWLNDAKQILYRERDLRQHPDRDEKILTAWNGLMIKGMATTGRILNRHEFIDSAQLAVTFINKNLWQKGRLLASYKDSNAQLNAYLDDYAFLIDGLLALLQAQWHDENFRFVIQLCEVLLTHFEDTENGGFYFTADDHEQLIQRPKLFTDEALPAGNGIAAFTLLRIGYLLGNTRYITAAQRTLECAWDNIQNTPYAHNTLLHALEEHLYPTEIIILRGNTEKLCQWKTLCDARYRPRSLILSIPNDASDLAEGLAKKSIKGDIIAYVCHGQTCQTPITDLDQFEKHLNENLPQRHGGHRD